MNQQEFNEKVYAPTIKAIADLMTVKGGEYAGSEDRLANFKRGAALTGCTAQQVLFIYLSKHYDAVATYVRDGATGVERRRSESINGRLDDIINYCILLKGLVYEDEMNKKRIGLELEAEMKGDKIVPGSWNDPAVIAKNKVEKGNRDAEMSVDDVASNFIHRTPGQYREG